MEEDNIIEDYKQIMLNIKQIKDNNLIEMDDEAYKQIQKYYSKVFGFVDINKSSDKNILRKFVDFFKSKIKKDVDNVVEKQVEQFADIMSSNILDIAYSDRPLEGILSSSGSIGSQYETLLNDCSNILKEQIETYNTLNNQSLEDKISSIKELQTIVNTQNSYISTLNRVLGKYDQKEEERGRFDF